MGKTYIFFEHNNELFFERIVEIYKNLISNYYKDAREAYLKNDTYNFYKNYNDALVFPACDYNNDLQCPHTVCGKEKTPVLSEDQIGRISITLHQATDNLRGYPGVNDSEQEMNDSIIDRIYETCFYFLQTRSKPLDYKQSCSLTFFLQQMRSIGGDPDADKLIYVCSQESRYDYFRNEMAKTKTIDRCANYQGL